MSAPTPKLRTNSSLATIEIRVRGPAQNKAEALRLLSACGFVDASTGIPWRQAFPEMIDSHLPGVCLRGARQREHLTQVQLAQRTGLPQRHISEMENGKRPIGKKNARLIGEVLGIAYQIFL